MACWDCFSTWTCDLLPQKCCYLIVPCSRPMELALEKWPVARNEYTPQSVRLLTYNIQQLVHFQDNEVARNIARALVKSEYDIVVLNELFDETSRRLIKSRLKSAQLYSHVVPRAGRERYCGLGEDSGLFVASRFPIVSVRFMAFANSKSSDKLANKGLLLVVFKVNGVYCLLGTTHLQAHRSGENVRELQLKDCMKMFIAEEQRVQADFGSKPVSVLCGDLNVTDVSGAERAGFTGDRNPFGNPAEYSKMEETIRKSFPDAVDCYRHHHPDAEQEPGYTFDAIESSNSKFKSKQKQKMQDKEVPPEQERLDYAWILRPTTCSDAKVTSTACDIDKRDCLSDHYGLQVTLNFLGSSQVVASSQPSIELRSPSIEERFER